VPELACCRWSSNGDGGSAAEAAGSRRTRANLAPNAIIASNTSSFPITAQKNRLHPERSSECIGGEPAQIMRYLEIVPGGDFPLDESNGRSVLVNFRQGADSAREDIRRLPFKWDDVCDDSRGVFLVEAGLPMSRRWTVISE